MEPFKVTVKCQSAFGTVKQTDISFWVHPNNIWWNWMIIQGSQLTAI